EIEKGGESILIDETTGNPIYQAADSDEGAGLGRALQALRFADATSPEVGQFRYLFEDGDSAQTLADNEWRALTFFDGKPRVETMVIMGLLDPWTPQGDMARVAGIFNRPAVVKFDRASEFPFMS